MSIESISAVTLLVRDMERAVGFYGSIGFERQYGGGEADFTCFRVGDGYLNLMHRPDFRPGHWGRVIFYVDDVDALYSLIVEKGLALQAPPRDAPWGERFFHLTDPDGHELSFARPLTAGA